MTICAGLRARVNWAEIVPSELDRFQKRGRS